MVYFTSSPHTCAHYSWKDQIVVRLIFQRKTRCGKFFSRRLHLHIDQVSDLGVLGGVLGEGIGNKLSLGGIQGFGGLRTFGLPAKAHAGDMCGRQHFLRCGNSRALVADCGRVETSRLREPRYRYFPTAMREIYLVIRLYLGLYVPGARFVNKGSLYVRPELEPKGLMFCWLLTLSSRRLSCSAFMACVNLGLLAL